MEILARAVGRRKEAVAQVQMVRGTGQLIINSKPAHEYLQNDSCAILSVQAPFEILKKSRDGVSMAISASQNGVPSQALTQTSSLSSNAQGDGLVSTVDTIVKVKGGGLKGQAEAVRLGIARALCSLNSSFGLSSVSNDTGAISRDGVSDAGVSSADGDLGSPEMVMPAPRLETNSISNAGAGSPEMDATKDLRKQLKDKGFLTQDSRVKERRKYGLKKARKATQYHKR